MGVRFNNKSLASGVVIFLLVSGVAAAHVTRARWMPALSQALLRFSGTSSGGDNAQVSHEEGASGHEEHGHDHPNDDPDAIDVSDQARMSIGLETHPVELTTYERSLSIPGIVMEQPGKTEIQVATPMTALVTEVSIITGEAVAPGKLLFRLRPTHEDLVEAQTKFIQTLGELDVEISEIERLTGITKGAIAGKVVLEREYAKRKLEATQSALREALLLHGLTVEQIASIAKDRKLVREIDVFAPSLDDISISTKPAVEAEQQISEAVPAKEPPTSEAPAGPLIVQELLVHKGQSVQAGETLCQLANFGNLYIRGDAFDRDSEALMQANSLGLPVSATIERENSKTEQVSGLKIHYVANEIDPESRALHFYVKLPNSPIQDAVGADGHRFVSWKFRPGQRVQLRVQIEESEEKWIVVPIAAVAQDGLENYVFEENGNRFMRRKVTVKYRDPVKAVIENDGSIFPGDIIAFTGALQLQLAIKNKSGGAIDPHAGHHH